MIHNSLHHISILAPRQGAIRVELGAADIGRRLLDPSHNVDFLETIYCFYYVLW